MIKKSSVTALGGMMAALSVVFMFMTGLIPFLTFAMPALCGVLLILLVLEANTKWALGVYAAVSILSLLLAPDKEAAVMYIAFFGYYPVAKYFLESRFNKTVSWVLKFLLFNAAIVLAYIVIIYVFNIPLDELEEYGKIAIPVLLGMGNVVFAVYDVALTLLISTYLSKWQKQFRKIFR